MVATGLTNCDRTWVVCQLGARMNYAVPRILHQGGGLERLYTDLYPGQVLARLLRALPDEWRPFGMQRLLGRVASQLPAELIKSYPLFGLAYYARGSRAKSPDKLSSVYLWAGKCFGARVVRDGFGKADAVYTFNTAALEILRAARTRRMFAVVEQTSAPRAIEDVLLADEQARHIGFEAVRSRGGAGEVIIQRERGEWALADVIVCGSDFVRDGIARCGGPVERCIVVPYGVDCRVEPIVRERTDGPLRVLTVGHVCLQKGAAYALEVARALGAAAEFRWVGRVTLLDEAKANLARHARLTGAVARDHVMQHYSWADVLFLPSISEGSATVTYEALASGLPVVTTPNAGSIVRDGVDGFIVPTNDAEAMTARLRQLHYDRALLARFSGAALHRSLDVSMASYQQRLLQRLSRRSIGRAPLEPVRPTMTMSE